MDTETNEEKKESKLLYEDLTNQIIGAAKLEPSELIPRPLLFAKEKGSMVP